MSFKTNLFKTDLFKKAGRDPVGQKIVWLLDPYKNKLVLRYLVLRKPSR